MHFILIFISIFLSSCTCGTISSDYKLGEVDSEEKEDSVSVKETGNTEVESPVDTDENPSDSTPPAPPDSGQPAPTGMGGGMVQIGSTWTPCVDCFIGVPEIDSFGAAVFHSSTVNTWYDWIPAIGTCTFPSGPNVNPSDYYDVGNFIQVISPFSSTTLMRFYESGRPTYRSGIMNFSPNSGYELAVGMNSTLGDFSIPDAVSTPKEFTHAQPSQYFTSDPYSGFFGILRRGYANQFTYAPYGESDFFIVTIDVYDDSGSTYLGGVMCVDLDDGSMTMPAGTLSSFPSYSLVAITYYKWIVTESIVPTTGDTVEGVGQYGLVGTATLQ